MRYFFSRRCDLEGNLVQEKLIVDVNVKFRADGMFYVIPLVDNQHYVMCDQYDSVKNSKRCL